MTWNIYEEAIIHHFLASLFFLAFLSVGMSFFRVVTIGAQLPPLPPAAHKYDHYEGFYRLFYKENAVLRDPG